MYVIMCEFPDAMNLFAPDCGSWTVTARGTSMRSVICPFGREALPWVDQNNCTVARSIGCKYACICCNYVWLAIVGI